MEKERLRAVKKEQRGAAGNDKLLKEPVTRSLLLFAGPMILGNLLQQLYNVADTYIVGHFLGPDALAAVGSSFTLMTFLTSVILGLCMGSGVLFSMLFGGGELQKLKNAFFISFVSIAGLTAVLEAFCLVFIDEIIRCLNIPEDVFAQTHTYLFYIFIGLFFTFLYNYFASALRALGNSRIPLVFLGASALLNIVLDIYFIASLHMGVAGAAIATAVSQAVSGLGIMGYVWIFEKEFLPEKRACYFNVQVFKKIKDYSLLTCVQQSVMNFGILMIQGLVNSFGLVTMSAFAAAVKIDSFAYMPVQDFGNAFSTFIAQNKGAGQQERIQKGMRSAVIVSALFCLAISGLVFTLAGPLMRIFIEAEETEIIARGVEYLRIEGACYLGIGCLFLLYGYYRGVGKPGISVVLTVISLGTRVALAYIFAPAFGPAAIWWAIPIGWILADAAGVLYGIRKERWAKGRVRRKA